MGDLLKHRPVIAVGLASLWTVLLVGACQGPVPHSYQEVVQEIQSVTPVYELVSEDGLSRLAIAPEMQGKVLTSTYDGPNGAYNGWLNLEAWRDKPSPETNIGGEDRLWIGPLGSQYSFYYQQKEPLDEANWQVPAPLREGAYELVEYTSHKMTLQSRMQLTNFLGTRFDLCVIRQIKLIDQATAEANLGIQLDEGCRFVAFECMHHLINTGQQDWKRETGLAGLWSLNMIQGTNQTFVSIPLDSAISQHDIYQYLGPLEADRLQVDQHKLLFRADGKYRSKIGIPSDMAPRIYGCYAPEFQRLTIIQYSKSNDSLYFNSEVSIQKNPYVGEAISVYNHGRMDYQETEENQFFELESASALQTLSPGDRLTHVHRIYHISAPPAVLRSIGVQLLNIDPTSLPTVFATQ